MRLWILVAALAASCCTPANRLRSAISAPAPSIGPERVALANNLAAAFRTVPARTNPGCIRHVANRQETDYCIVFRTDDDPPAIAAYLSSAYTLTDELCDTFFRSTNSAARHREGLRADVNDLGTLVTSILGISNAGAIATSVVASATGFSDNIIRNYDAAFLVSPDLASLQPLVHAEQNELRQATDKKRPMTWGEARSAALRYAEPCTYTGMKRLLTKSAQVLTTVKTEPSLTSQQIRTIAAADTPVDGAPAPASAPAAATLPTVRWGATPERAEWTRAAQEEVKTAGAALWAPGFLPADIADFCPDYDRRGAADRQAFWVGLVSALAEKETIGFDPQAVGDGGTSIGLLQLSTPDRTRYDCDFLTDAAIVQAVPNIRCAIRIMATLVPRDAIIAAGSDTPSARGAARYWGPLRRNGRRQIADWTARQTYCVRS